jgi:hypothetical protein
MLVGESGEFGSVEVNFVPCNEKGEEKQIDDEANNNPKQLIGKRFDFLVNINVCSINDEFVGDTNSIQEGDNLNINAYDKLYFKYFIYD